MPKKAKAQIEESLEKKLRKAADKRRNNVDAALYLSIASLPAICLKE